jgi:Family of unknown function (DUF5329)
MLSHIKPIARFATACVVVLASIFLASGAFAVPPAPLSEAAKIDALIRAVEAHSDLRFLRNDVEYSASEAALHLRMKLAIAGSQIKTVDDFIEHLATGSSVTGKPYLVRFIDGKLVPSAEFLRGELKRLSQPTSISIK